MCHRMHKHLVSDAYISTATFSANTLCARNWWPVKVTPSRTVTKSFLQHWKIMWFTVVLHRFLWVLCCRSEWVVGMIDCSSFCHCYIPCPFQFSFNLTHKRLDHILRTGGLIAWMVQWLIINSWGMKPLYKAGHADSRTLQHETWCQNCCLCTVENLS